MEKTRTQNTVLNIGGTIFLQLISAISGLILPRMLIQAYGSETNGLISSIVQFLSYIALLEGGAGAVVRTALYKPLANQDMKKVSGIIRASKNFYLRIAGCFAIYIVGLCVVYPMITNTEFDLIYIISLIIILSVSNMIEYIVGCTYSTLLIADQKVRIVNLINCIAIIFNILATLFLVKLHMPIQFVKLTTCLIFVAKPISYMLYVKRHYRIDKNIEADKEALEQRTNGLVHQIAFFVHTNTDIFLITLFMGATDVSIYAVYYAVVSGIEKIAVSFANGSTASIGNLLATENKNNIKKFFDKYEFVQMAMITILFTTTAIMIIPFMNIYTSGFENPNYINPIFAYILIASESVYCIRCVYGTVSIAANKFKETQIGATLEAIINIVISIILINFFGLVGVAIGTLCAMSIRACYEILYMSKKVIDRQIVSAIKAITINLVIAFGSICLCQLLQPLVQINNWGMWVLFAAISFCVTTVLALILYLLFYKKIVFDILRHLKKGL